MPQQRTYTLSDFDFHLPETLIAQHPAPERTGSRLLDGTGSTPVDRSFTDLPNCCVQATCSSLTTPKSSKRVYSATNPAAGGLSYW